MSFVEKTVRTAVIGALASSLMLSAGCIDEYDDLSTDDQPIVLDIVGIPALADETPRGIYYVISSEYAESQVETTAPDVMYAARYIFYMNKDGGTYTPGNNDSRTNRTTVPTTTSQIPAWNISASDWQEVMTCVREQFSAYDVDITDVDPGNVPHIESVVAGSPGDLGMDPGVGGVSPFRSDCGVIDNSIVFTFAEVFADTRIICEVVAQEVAHSFGLDHQFLCADPMTYLSGCGQKAFTNVDAPCGEFAERPCACGNATQNSVAMLSARIGTKNPDNNVPTIAITYPADGALVKPGFTVTVDATDDVAVQQVDLLIDGVLADIKTTAPYTFVTDSTLSEGTHVIETVARDGTSQSSSSISVTVDNDADDSGPGGGTEPPGGGGNGTGDPTRPDLVGGCSTTGSGSSSGSSFALLLLGLALSMRRRRD